MAAASPPPSAMRAGRGLKRSPPAQTKISGASTGTPVQELARKAPSATPGHILYPPRTRADRAIPVGAQTAVMLLFSAARARPTLAAPKYAAATPATFAT